MPNLAHATEKNLDKNTDGLDDDQAIRANTYALLGALLAQPADAEMLSTLASIEAEAAEQKKGIINAWSTLRLAAERAHPQGVAEEFHALFIGLGRGELIPYASWYLTGFLMEKPLAHLRTRLDELGFERQDEVKEPEDHAAALCEVMGLLIHDAAVDFETEQKFFNDFLHNWMSRFFQDLQTTESAGFYRAVGQIGEEFLAIERRYFSMMV